MARNENAELIIRAARRHGDESEGDHEIGDLQAALRVVFQHMTPAQQVRALREIDEDMGTWIDMVQDEDDGV